MSILKLPVPGSTFNAQLSVSLVPSTVSGTPTPSNGILTVTTTAAHGLSVGQAVTFTGSSNNAYNGVVFKVLSVPSSTTFTVASTLGQLTGTTISAVPVYYPPPGFYYVVTGANAVWFFDPGNLSWPQSDPTQTLTGGAQTTIIAASAKGFVWTDGFGAGLLCNGSAGTTVLSQVR
ncbi:MAG: hypothetical protein IRY96_03245 [Burkholderiales bacterium]|nr:hypothetical protein [Burkholderiales bacterium]